MAQTHEEIIVVSVPITLHNGNNTHDAPINAVLRDYQGKGYDFMQAVYVQASNIAPHFQLFFARNK